jgi:lipopolysaccharide biosynthesis glycosyltransferase
MSFGIVIVCAEKDFALAKGCIASVRYFMPQVDICLLIDGYPELGNIQETYNCTIIQKHNVKDPFLRTNSFGWGITKMIAFWESPFDHFLLLDADTCVWGNLAQGVEWESYDMVIDQPHYSFDDKAINTWFFDTKRLRDIDPLFQPELYSRNYFCTGVFFSRKQVFDLEWYKELIELSKKEPNLFKYGEMGMLNYMIFRSVQDEKINVKNEYIQHICPDYDKRETRKLFPIQNKKPKVNGRPMAIHYNGNRKPYRNNMLAYHLPMTLFRELHYHTAIPNQKREDLKRLLIEEDKQFERIVTPKETIKNVLRPYLKQTYVKLKCLAEKFLRKNYFQLNEGMEVNTK